jgi:exosome complex RNA-binding protein Csl4
MNKAGVVLFALLALIGVSVLAADTLITGYDTTTGLGTFKVVSDGTHSTLTVDKIVASNATGLTNVTAATALTMQRQTVASVTNVVLTLQRGDVVYGDVTNSLLTNVVITVQSAPVAAVTNATAATTLTVEF